MKTSVVYEITDTITGLKYIGSKRDWKGPGTYFGTLLSKTLKVDLQKAWKHAAKERPETFTFEILYERHYNDISKSELYEFEGLIQRHCNVVKSLEYVNAALANKGFGGYEKGECPQSTRDKLSIVGKNKVYTDSWRSNMSKSLKGHKHSIESRKLMSTSHTGVKLSDIHRKSISDNYNGGMTNKKLQ